MARIGNIDHVLILLQQQLQKLDSADRKPQARRSGDVTPARSRSFVERIASLSARESLSEEQIERLAETGGLMEASP